MANPTYHDLGNHSETIQIDYDPKKISYSELLNIFWDSHRPTSRSYSRQYKSIIFFHNEEQKQAALESKKKREALWGEPVYTDMVPFTRFTRAEDYHQKYYLRQVKNLMQALQTMYPDPLDLTDSATAAKINGYVAKYGDRASLEKILPYLGLTKEEERILIQKTAK